MFGVALLIFVAETSVVALDTLRIIFVARGYKLLSVALSLVVVSIWLFAISQIMKNIECVECFMAYASGYCLGVYLGISIEERLALGAQLVRIITNKDAASLIKKLRQTNHGVTYLPAQGATGPVHLIFTIVQRRELPKVVELIRKFDPNTFYTVEDVRQQQAGVFPSRLRPSARESLGVPVQAVGELVGMRQTA
jgi:uncharacterized protein YebE (UPF0316 family)